MELEKEIRQEVKKALEHVTLANSPNVYRQLYLPSGKVNVLGYSRIEDRVLRMVIANQIAPAAAIPQIEQQSELS